MAKADETPNSSDWQIGLQKIANRTSKILETSQYFDVEFLVGHDSRRQVIRAHKLILAISSPVFEAMFYGSMADQQNQPIEVSDITPHAFNSLLKFIYSDELQFSAFEQVCEICYAAKKYMIPLLVEKCLQYIWKDLTPGNVCRAHAFVMLFEEAQLLQQCFSLIQMQTESVVADPSFEEAEMSTLKMIVNQDNLNISEFLLWEGIVRWSKQECMRQNLDSNSQTQRKVIGELLPHIRFLNLTAAEFANGPALTNILSQEECFQILMNISSPGVSEMPLNFSTSSASRIPAPCIIIPNSREKVKCIKVGRPISISQRQRLILENKRKASCSSGSINMETEDNEEQLFCNCAGPLRDTFFNDELVDCTLSFSVDRDICIVGVVLPTQLKPQNSVNIDLDPLQRESDCFRSCCSVNKYPELIYAFLQDADGCRLTYTHFSARVPWQNSMEVLFNKPVNICSNVKHEIVVVLNKRGRYPLYTTAPRVHVGNVNFTFLETHLNPESIVKTLIFKSEHKPRLNVRGMVSGLN